MYFIFDLICKIIWGKFYGEMVIFWGDGYQWWELVFVEDFVCIVLELVVMVDNDLVNIGVGEEFIICCFVELICQEVDYDFNLIEFDISCYVGVKLKCLGVKKFYGLMLDL